MASIHSDILKRHKKILRERMKCLNDGRERRIKFSQKNLDLLLYINYVRFLNALILKASDIASKDSSSEILVKHMEESGNEILKRFRG